MNDDKDRAAFEAWAQDYYHGTQRDIALAAWQAATAAERERAALIAESLSAEPWVWAVSKEIADRIRSGE